jgi:hypothetical protein
MTISQIKARIKLLAPARSFQESSIECDAIRSLRQVDSLVQSLLLIHSLFVWPTKLPPVFLSKLLSSISFQTSFSCLVLRGAAASVTTAPAQATALIPTAPALSK